MVTNDLFGPIPANDTVVTIGVFDGVHLGHQNLISKTKEEASSRELLSAVCTFRNDPLTVLKPDFKPRYIMGLDRRLELIKSMGVDLVIPIDFTRDLSQLTAREFASLLRENLRARVLVSGPDFALGRSREGDVPTLTRLGEEMGFTVVCLGPTVLEGQMVSSTAIREALNQGGVDKVARLLGRPFSIQGRVVVGEKRGRLLGFPTANIDVTPNRALPADGVYASTVHLGATVRQSITYIGSKPTFDGLKHSKEVYIFDFEGDLYGQELSVDIIAKLRGDIRYEGPDALIEQMNKDVAMARELLAKV